MSSLGTVLVIGGSSGIGLAVAQAVLETGARVVISSSNASRLEEAAASLAKVGPGRIFHHVADLADVNTQEANLTSLLEFSTSATGGKISHIAFTAGDSIKSVPLASFDPRNGLVMAHVRYLAPLTLAKLAPAYLIPGPESSITFTTGSSTLKPSLGTSTWLGLGGAIETAMRGLAREQAPLRFNVVAPGTIETPLLEGIAKHVGQGDTDEAKKQQFFEMVSKDNLLNTVGKPEATAQAYLYFMRDKFQTGTVLTTDGGRLLK